MLFFLNQWNHHTGIESCCNLREFKILWKGESGRALTMARTPYCFSTLSFSCLKHASILSWKGLRASVTFSPWILMPSARNGICKAQFGCSTLPSPSRAKGWAMVPQQGKSSCSNDNIRNEGRGIGIITLIIITTAIIIDGNNILITITKYLKRQEL